MGAEGTHVHDSERLSKQRRMDVSLCERLPNDLLEKIVFRLPIRDIFHVRAVCHRFKALVDCPGFGLLRAREDVPSEPPWFFMLTPTDDTVHEVTKIAAYYPSVNKWHWMWQPTTNMLYGFNGVSSDGGLICYYNSAEHRAMVVNPLTKAYRRLPRGPTNMYVDGICLVVDRATRSYQVILICRYENRWPLSDKGFTIVVEAYQSSSDSWYRINKSPPLSISGLLYPERPLHAGGCLHMLCRETSELLVFNLDEQVWRRIEVPFLRSVYREHVVPWQERLFIIAEKRGFNGNGSWCLTDICVWELHKASSSWVLFDRMPDSLFQEFCHHDEGQQVRLVITPVADCSLVLLTFPIFNEEGGPVMSVTSFKTVLYDLEKQAWTMVEGCPLRDLGDMSMVENVGYEPRLDAMV